ncbi:MAG: hypothetical protein ABSF84_06125 [Acidimicrobiales bacterium]
MAARSWTATGAVLTLVVVASACSSPTALVRHVTATTSAPTTTDPTPTTTLPSAVPTTVPTPVVTAVGWSAPITTLPPAGGYTSVSCISDVFCLAAGGGSNEADAADSTGPGAVTSWDGATWGTPVDYFPQGPGTDPAPWLPAIACTDGPLCAVVDGSGHASLGDGTTWSPPAQLATWAVATANPDDPGPGTEGSRSAAVSCPASQFCAYVDNTGHVAVMQGSGWSTPQAFTTRVGSSTVGLFQAGRVGVACTGTSACTAMVDDTVLDWEGGSWVSSVGPWGTDGGQGDTALSCPTAGTCFAVHGSDVSERTPGSGWSPPVAIDGDGHLDAIACPDASTCVAADAYGDVVRWSGGVWSAPQKVVPTPTGYAGDGTSLSCPTTQFCMVITGDGDYATYQGATPVPPSTPTSVP